MRITTLAMILAAATAVTACNGQSEQSQSQVPGSAPSANPAPAPEAAAPQQAPAEAAPGGDNQAQPGTGAAQ